MDCCKWTHTQKTNNATNTFVYWFSLKRRKFLLDVCVTWICMWHPCLSRRYNDVTFNITLCWSSLLIRGESVCLRVQSDLSLCVVQEILLSGLSSTFSPIAVAFQRCFRMTQPKTGPTDTHRKTRSGKGAPFSFCFPTYCFVFVSF